MSMISDSEGSILHINDACAWPISTINAAMKLLGNANTQISHLQCIKIINKVLLPLVEGDSNFGRVSPSLYGLEFVQKSMKLVDQVKVM